MPEIDRFAVIKNQPLGRLELRCGVNDVYFSLFGELCQTAGQAIDDFVLPCAQGNGVDPRFAELNALVRHRFGFVDEFRHMQQCFGRDTADIEANTAEDRPALHQRHFQAQVGCPESGGVAADTSANHNQFCAVCSGRRRPGRRTGRF